MREIANKERTLALLQHLGQQAKGPMDVDLKLAPEPSGIFQAIAEAKDSLNINIELASPDLFIPELPGWQDRSKHITSVGDVEFYHYDLYSQALAKIERSHERDLRDVNALLDSDLVERSRLWDLFLEIEKDLIRFPNLNPKAFRSKVEQICKIS